MLVDANLRLCAVEEVSPHHSTASDWLTAALNGSRRVALPWQSIGAFVRISTHPRIAASPLTGPEAWSFVDEWLSSPVAWLPPASARSATILGELVDRHGLTGNAIPDAQLAAMAVAHGLTACSADSDFARFTEVRWVNPLV